MDDAFVIYKLTPTLCKRCGVDPARRGKILCVKCYQEAKKRKAELARRRRRW